LGVLLNLYNNDTMIGKLEFDYSNAFDKVCDTKIIDKNLIIYMLFSSGYITGQRKKNT